MRRVIAVVGLALWVPALAGAGSLQSAAALSRQLQATGRAEATVRYLVAAPGGAPRAVHARLAIEPPDRTRLDVPGTGEKIVARADGGEWLQPALRQVLHFRANQAASALRWWRVLLGEQRAARERSVGKGRYVLTLLDGSGAPVDSALVVLDARGLPLRLEAPANQPDAAVYRLSGWRFSRARGAAAFRIAVPVGFERIELP